MLNPSVLSVGRQDGVAYLFNLLVRAQHVHLADAQHDKAFQNEGLDKVFTRGTPTTHTSRIAVYRSNHQVVRV